MNDGVFWGNLSSKVQPVAAGFKSGGGIISMDGQVRPRLVSGEREEEDEEPLGESWCFIAEGMSTKQQLILDVDQTDWNMPGNNVAFFNGNKDVIFASGFLGNSLCRMRNMKECVELQKFPERIRYVKCSDFFVVGCSARFLCVFNAQDLSERLMVLTPADFESHIGHSDQIPSRHKDEFCSFSDVALGPASFAKSRVELLVSLSCGSIYSVNVREGTMALLFNNRKVVRNCQTDYMSHSRQLLVMSDFDVSLVDLVHPKQIVVFQCRNVREKIVTVSVDRRRRYLFWVATGMELLLVDVRFPCTPLLSHLLCSASTVSSIMFPSDDLICCSCATGDVYLFRVAFDKGNAVTWNGDFVYASTFVKSVALKNFCLTGCCINADETCYVGCSYGHLVQQHLRRDEENAPPDLIARILEVRLGAKDYICMKPCHVDDIKINNEAHQLAAEAQRKRQESLNELMKSGPINVPGIEQFQELMGRWDNKI